MRFATNTSTAGADTPATKAEAGRFEAAAREIGRQLENITDEGDLKMARVKKRIFAGAVCQQIVYNVSDRAAEPTKAKPKKPRFESAEERAEFNRQIARRRFARDVNANFTPRGYYVTLTFDIEHELHTFDDARRVRDNYIRRLLRACPEGRGFIVMGRGKSTNRIHMHMICEGISPEIIRAKWGLGEVVAVTPLRGHNFYNGIDCGQDYTALAYYCFDHWTQEQGGHRYKRFGELRKQNNALEISLDAASQQLDKTRDTLKKTDSMRRSASSAAKAMHERLDLLYILIPAALRMPRNDADALLAELPADIGAMQNTELFEVCDKYINGGG